MLRVSFLAVASRIISDTVDAGFIKPADVETTSKKYMTYIHILIRQIDHYCMICCLDFYCKKEPLNNQVIAMLLDLVCK